MPAEAVLENNRVLLMQAMVYWKSASSNLLANWNMVEGLSGLNAGDRVVLSVGRDGVVCGRFCA